MIICMNLIIYIQIKLFTNFHNKIIHLFFHHFGRELATATLTTYLLYLPYLPYIPYLPYLPYLPSLTTLPTLPTLPLPYLPSLPSKFGHCVLTFETVRHEREISNAGR